MARKKTLTVWCHAVMKESFVNFDLLERVLVIQSAIKHTHPALGASYFVMSRHNDKILLVNEAEFGPGLSKILRRLEPVKPENQALCTKRAKSLLMASVYHPKRRETHTNFFKKRRKKP